MALRPPGNLTVTSPMLVCAVRYLEPRDGASDGVGPRTKALERARNRHVSRRNRIETHLRLRGSTLSGRDFARLLLGRRDGDVQINNVSE